MARDATRNGNELACNPSGQEGNAGERRVDVDKIERRTASSLARCRNLGIEGPEAAKTPNAYRKPWTVETIAFGWFGAL